jgi:hypothetical protein
MPRASPPRGFIDREQQALPMSRPRPRRRIRRSRGDRLLELLRMFGIRRAALSLIVLIQMVLLLVALVPQTVWATLGYPNGPIPDALTPLVAGAFYLLPALTGALCRRWQAAVVLATLPAWLDLGVFAVAAAGRIGPFYLVLDPHAANTVGTLELFAVLGALGWLARVSLLAVLEQRKGNRL